MLFAMEDGPHLAAVDGLLESLEQARSQLEADIDNGLTCGERLRSAARVVGESSSGSWIGWHSRMYYADYSEPPAAESWDSEWGGLHGYSAHWRERSQAEVQQTIERQVGLTLADLAETADRVRKACQALQREVLTVLSPICDLGGLEKEAKLLQKTETIEWILSPGDLIKVLSPRQVASRDSMAASQGLQAPLHLNVEAAIVSNTNTIAASRDFLNDGIRLARQVRTKLQATSARDRFRAAAIGEPTDEQLRRQLRRRSLVLFALAALAVIAGATRALNTIVSHPVAQAAVVVTAALLTAGLYAILVNRAHARWALAVAATLLGAVAAVDQLAGRL